MSQFTRYFKLPFPDDSKDPFFDEIEAFFDAQDQVMYALTAASQPIMAGGFSMLTNVSVAPNPYIGTFTWTDDYLMVIPGSGFYLHVQFGPDNLTRSATLTNGDRLCFNIPVTSSADVNTNMIVINGAITNETVTLLGLVTLGIYYNGQFFSKLPRVFP